MDNVPCLDTAMEDVDECPDLTDDTDGESFSGETPVDEVDLSDPILHLLPCEGYRILRVDTQSSSVAAQIKVWLRRTV